MAGGSDGPKHSLELLAQPLDCVFHSVENLLVSSNVEGDVTVFDFDKDDAGESLNCFFRKGRRGTCLSMYCMYCLCFHAGKSAKRPDGGTNVGSLAQPGC